MFVDGHRDHDLPTFIRDHLDVEPFLLATVLDSNIVHDLRATILLAQDLDPKLSQIKLKIRAAAISLQPIQNQYRQFYTIRDDLLGVAEADGRWRVMIPDDHPLRTTICQLVHDHEGHAGVHRTTQAITAFFIWTNMFTFIRKYVVSCLVCQQANKANRLPGGYAHPFDVPPTPGLDS